MRLLFIGGYPNPVTPYFRVFFKNLIVAMADNGIECYVIAPVSLSNLRNKVKTVPEIEEEKTSKGNIIRIYRPRYVSYSNKSIIGFNTGIFSELSFQHAVLKCVKKLNIQFDATYGHFFIGGGLAAIKAGRYLNIPSFVAYGECNYNDEVVKNFRKLKSRDLRGIRGVISVSSYNSDVLRSLPIFKNIPIVVIPNAVDTNLFRPMDKKECRKVLSLPNDSFIVGFVGGFIDRKGDKRLLEAINNIEDAYVAFAGKGSVPPSGNKVIFCESLSHDKIPVFLNSIDIFCLPTLNEGSCNAIVEAMACAKPIISSDLEFNYDVLNKNNSILIDPTSVKEIKDAIVLLKSDRSLQNSFSKNAFNSSHLFDIRSRAIKIINFIKKNI